MFLFYVPVLTVVLTFNVCDESSRILWEMEQFNDFSASDFD